MPVGRSSPGTQYIISGPAAGAGEGLQSSDEPTDAFCEKDLNHLLSSLSAGQESEQCYERGQFGLRPHLQLGERHPS